MSRYGGAAAYGRAWVDVPVSKYDDYGYGPAPKKEPRISNENKITLGGAGVGLLGVKQFADSRNVGNMAADRKAQAIGQLRSAKIEHKRTQQLRNEFHTQQGLRGPITGPLRGGKAKRLDFEVEAARQRKVQAKGLVKLHDELNTPEKLKLRGRHMRRMGVGLGAAGAAVVGSRLIPPRRAAEPAVEKALVNKTITQARYGGQVESGRAWRGEKKDNEPVAGKVAVGLGGTAVGGGMVGLAGATRLSRATLSDPSKRHSAEHKTSLRAIKGHIPQEQAALDLKRRAQAASEAHDLPGLHAVRRDAGLSPTQYRITRNPRPTKGKVAGGKIVGFLEEEQRARTKHGKGLEAAHEKLKGTHAKEKALALKDIKTRKVARPMAIAGGLTAAIAGGGALAAAAAAEKRRGSFGRVRRDRPAQAVQRQAAPPVEAEKKHWSEELSPRERDRWSARGVQ